MGRPDATPARRPPAWLRAMGAADFPPTLGIGGVPYRHLRTFKHDFFAATALYEGSECKAVVKVGRNSSALGVPLKWLGRALTHHEVRIYQVLADLQGPGRGLPRFLGEVGPTGFAHEYVEGRPLSDVKSVGDAYFDQLRALLAEVHRRDTAYVDLNKPDNVLVGDDGRPYLIDFQISVHVAPRGLGRRWPLRSVLRLLQRSDEYHLLKQVRRRRPELLTDAERTRLDRPPLPIRLHRLIGRPFIQARRRVLVWLGARPREGSGVETGRIKS